MKNTFKSPFLVLTSILIATLCFSCKYNKFGEDTDIYSLAKATDNYIWYKGSSNQLAKSPGSGHAQPFFKTRFNNLAAQNLDSLFKVKANGKFKEGAVIVKELYEDGKLDLYAVLYKNSSHKNADSKGWVWGYINSDGSVRISSSKKGKDCANCHSQNGNEDYVLMNKFFP